MKCSKRLKDYENALPSKTEIVIDIERIFKGFSATDGVFEITFTDWTGKEFKGRINDKKFLSMCRDYKEYKGEERFEFPDDL